MPPHGRAAHFSPFAALTGYRAVPKETSRLTSERLELSEGKQPQINELLQIILENIREKPEVKITFFVADKRKAAERMKPQSAQ